MFFSLSNLIELIVSSLGMEIVTVGACLVASHSDTLYWPGSILHASCSKKDHGRPSPLHNVIASTDVIHFVELPPLLLALDFLPRRRLGLSNLRARSTRPALDSDPHIPRRLTSILANHSASAPTRASTLTARQPSEHAAPPFRLLLLV